jgi:predicted permease
MRDLFWAWRFIRRRPLFAATVAATLAMGIATTTTAIGVGRAILWRPLPFTDAERLVFVWEATQQDGGPQASRVTGSRFADWRDHTAAFSAIARFGAAGATIESAEGARAIHGVRVSANYFATLGLAPALGRGFSSDDEVPGRHFVVILSHELWRQRFGGRSDIVGTSIQLSGQPFTVVGVMPAAVLPAWPVNPATVTIASDAREFWVPFARDPALDQNNRAHVFGVVGRLAGDTTPARAAAELTALSSPTAPDPHGAIVRPLREQLTSAARLPVLLVVGASLAVLLVACANLAALHMASFERRRVEIATRAALGAGAEQIMRQLATESLLIAAAGGVAGLACARVALRWIPMVLPPTVPFLTTPGVDLNISLGAAVATVLASLGFAGWPMRRLFRSGPTPRGVATPARSRMYGVLVAAQIAVTVALVSCAAWLGRSLSSIESRDPGFAIDNVVVADVSLPAHARDAADIVALEDRLRAALEVRSGVRGVALSYDHPLEANWTGPFPFLGEDAAVAGDTQAQLRIVSPSYFETLDVAVLDGRTFTDRDTIDQPGIVVVNEAFARRAGRPVLGRAIASQTPRMTWSDQARDVFTIEGIVENERFNGLEEPSQPAVYMSTRQFPQRSFSLVMRTSVDPAPLVADVRSIVQGVDRRATLETPALLSKILATQLASRTITTDVLGSFAAAAMVLAALGLYGLLAMLVSGQTREIGVRLSLGATPSVVARGVVARSLRHTAAGLAAGLVLTVIAGRIVRSLLVDVSAGDPLTIAFVLSLTALTAFAAALVPAFRASRVDPVEALRSE